MSQKELSLQSKKSGGRLAFIDLARSIAIFMMLEGHITGELLSSQYRAENSSFYQLWRQLHGYTSPLFFTISGLVFAYLLTQPIEQGPIWKHPRVKKGLKRVVELLVWGYLLQFHFKNFIICQWEGSSYNTDWLMAFHVLQSIAVALLFLIASFFISKYSRVPFFMVAFFAGVAVFGCNGVLETYIRNQKALLASGAIDQLNYWPTHAPKWLQNMFFGMYSEFSFVRFSGYALLGGALGHFIRLNQRHVLSFTFGFTLFALGYVLKRDVYFMLEAIDLKLIDWGWQSTAHQMANKDSLIGLSMVMCLLGILITLNRLIKIPQSLFLKMGQNTFPIYIIHVIIIYEGLLGVGLPLEHYKEYLSPLQSWMISLFIISWFFVLINYWERIEKEWNNIKKTLIQLYN
jgi:hypothetical protein